MNLVCTASCATRRQVYNRKRRNRTGTGPQHQHQHRASSRVRAIARTTGHAPRALCPEFRGVRAVARTTGHAPSFGACVPLRGPQVMPRVSGRACRCEDHRSCSEGPHAPSVGACGVCLADAHRVRGAVVLLDAAVVSVAAVCPRYSLCVRGGMHRLSLDCVALHGFNATSQSLSRTRALSRARVGSSHWHSGPYSKSTFGSILGSRSDTLRQ
jgi:hypothetical protein